MSFLKTVLAYLMAAYSRLENGAQWVIGELDKQTSALERGMYGEERAGKYITGPMNRKAQRGQLGIFMVLVFGAVALVVVAIVLLFGMQIAGEFADGIEVTNQYSDEANTTVNATGNAFELFGTSVLVIPASAVLAVLIGGMIGAVTRMGGGGGGSVPGGR